MAKTDTYLSHLKSSSDLVTSSTETRAGFVSMALEKNYLAVPYIEEAKALKTIAGRAKTPNDLLGYPDLRPSLLAASGLSDKAQGYLTEDDNIKAIQGLIENFLEPAGEDFVNELVYRYLLIKGDALGGKARNLAGTLGERKFIRSLLSVLSLTGTNYYWLNDETLKWSVRPQNDAGIERNIKGLHWEKNSNRRVLLLNMKVPVVDKNVDICLLDGSLSSVILSGNTKDSLHRRVEKYIALGELKGGIDPAGADEHWKTANSALNRIRKSFAEHGKTPFTLFVGAAIENSMAVEIFSHLENGTLGNAANLTNDNQLMSLANWFLNL